MNVKFFILFCLPVAYCATAMEGAPVSDESEKELGYTCKSRSNALGLMKENEVRTNFIKSFCAKAVCNSGTISYTTCTVRDYTIGDCILGRRDFTKPYPECCKRKCIRT